MQMPENKAIHPDHAPQQGRGAETSHRPALTGGCISKQEVCFILRPNLSRTRDYVLEGFFTDERLQACNLTADELKRIRVFPADASAFIISELKRLNFL